MEDGGEKYNELLSMQVDVKAVKTSNEADEIIDGDEGSKIGGNKLIVALVGMGILIFAAAIMGAYLVQNLVGGNEQEEVESRVVQKKPMARDYMTKSNTINSLIEPSLTPTKEPAITPTPLISVTPTPQELLEPTLEPSNTPMPTNMRVADPPRITISYPAEGQSVSLGSSQKLCVVDEPAGGDVSGMVKKHRLNDEDWTNYKTMYTLCFYPQEGDSVFQVQYKNSFEEESEVYARQFTFTSL